MVIWTGALNQEEREDGGAAAVGGRGELRMCGECKAGPVALNACADLASHNDGSSAYKASTSFSVPKPNNCKNCGWCDENFENWPEWDGVWGPH